MNKKINLFVFILVFLGFMPFYTVKAVSSYSVEVVSSSSNNQVVGTYSNYSAALSAMNNHNSSLNSVATIYRDGIPVDSKYAIFKFKPSGKSTYPLYRNSNSSRAYTSINSSYGIDAALLGYSDNGRVKIMISGFTGWTDINNGIVTPISLLSGNMINVNGSGVNLRSGHSTSSSSIGKISGNYNFNYLDIYNGSDYTWYKINYNGRECWIAGGSWVTRYDSSLGTYYLHYGPTGNLIHHFTTYGGVSYNDSFTNLGTSPSYLTQNVWYYSFDGNYFYSNLTSMLDDYRSGSYSRSVNKDNPHYSYYLYLTSRSTTGYTASDFDNVIASKYNASQSKMYGTGVYFKEAEETYGTNALLAFSAALNESSWGTSSIAMNKNNLFGYGAADSCPYECAYSYNSPRDSIMQYASKSSTSYEIASGKYYYGSHYGNKSSGKNVNYATDPYWGEVMASNAFIRDKSFGGKDFNSNTIGVTKKGVSGVVVYRTADTSSPLYTMKNVNNSDAIYDFSVNIIDKVSNNGEDFYKIYTDLNTGDTRFGYVLVNNFNVSNSQPVINAQDKSILVGSNFNYLEGVSASDRENGDLTSRISYEGVVDTNKAGNYQVTYTVKDNSNFHVSKTINVKVQGGELPTIEASDKELIQFSEFDYMKDVKAKDSDGDLTSKIIYDGVVDTNKAGTYEISYKVSNAYGESTKKIKVTVIPNEKPVIEAADKNIFLNDNFNYLEGVKAYDKEDGDLEVTYEGVVDSSKAGSYKVTYYATDKNNQKTSKTITVRVINVSDISDEDDFDESNLNKKDGWFHLENITFNNDKLIVSGFNIITNISNSKNDLIKHKLILKSQNSDSEYTFSLDRWLEDTPFDPNDGSIFDYSGSWFTGEVSLNEIPQDDYTMYICSYTNDNYTKQVLSNMEYTNSIRRTYKDSNNRGYLLKENAVLETVDLELFVRNDGLITYGSVPVRGIMLNDFFEYDFSLNYLLITGSSYALKTDYKSSDIKREIILEDKITNKVVYREDIDFIDGPYKLDSLSNNDLTKAWFKAKIDLSKLDSSSYVIYIRTKVGNSDGYGELVDYAYSDLTKSTFVNNREVKLVRNNNHRVRLELVIK